MDESRSCPNCGAALPQEAPEAPCAACLMKLGLESWESQAAGGAAAESPNQRLKHHFEPPSPAELADRFPQFEILELLGHGGMGAVYKARQKSLDRFVALKIINPDAADDAGFAERFAREARALAKLSHPNIVAVYDFGESDSIFYFVMEFIDGANLRQLIESKELTPEQALEIVPKVCEALQFAHDQGIVHRDIKPENILVGVQPSSGRASAGVQVKIADFGLAKLLRESESESKHLTATHQVMGTPRYMAPEQMEGSRGVDHRADIYSLGVVFYEMLTGELPLGRFALPSEKVRVDVRLDEVVLRSLEKEPERRYQHASDVKTDLSAIREPEAAQIPLPRSADSPVQNAATPKPLSDEAARRQVSSPGIGLLLVGLLELVPFVMMLLTVPLLVVVPGQPQNSPPQIRSIPARTGVGMIGATTSDFLANSVIGAQAPTGRLTFMSLLIGALLTAGVPLAILFILAGLKMKQLKLYPLAVIASILAMLPCHAGFVIGLPIGIWSLVVLFRVEIREAFRANA